MSTRDSARRALEHVLSVVLEEPVPEKGKPTLSPFRSILTTLGVVDITDITDLIDKDLEDLKINLGDGTTRTITVREQRILSQLRRWYEDQITTNTSFNSSDWLQLTVETFDTWRQSHPWSRTQVQTVPIDSSTSSRGGGSTPLEKFRSGYKRLLTDFPKLTDNSHFLRWDREFITTTILHGVHNVVDLKEDPMKYTGDELDLYNAQNAYLFKVLETMLCTQLTRNIVREYEDTKDARAVYFQVHRTFENSGLLRQYAENAYDELTKFEFNDNWKNGAKNFLTKWNSLLQNYQEIKDSTIPEDTKMEILIKALRSNEEMRQAVNTWKTTRDLINKNGSNLNTSMTSTKEEFLSLWTHLENTATTYDVVHKIKRQTPRKANRTEQNNRLPKNFKKGYIPRAEFMRLTPAQRTEHLEATKDQRSKHNNERNTKKVQAYLSSLPSIPETISLNVNKVNNTPSSNDSTQFDLRTVLSNKASVKAPLSTVSTVPTTVSGITQGPETSYNVMLSNGHRYIQIDMAVREYSVRAYESTQDSKGVALVDRGANGGICGTDMRVIEVSSTDTASVSGVGSTTINNLPIVTAAALLQSQKGPIIGIFPQYAQIDTGHSIHSCLQMEAWGVEVDEKSKRLSTNPGKQRIYHPDGYILPISIRNGLPYIRMSVPTDKDMDLYPHVFFTEDSPWQPNCLDDDYSTNSLDNDNVSVLSTEDSYYEDSPFNDFGELISDVDRTAYETCRYTGDLEVDIDLLLRDVRQQSCLINKKERYLEKKDCQLLRPNFGWISAERIRKTLSVTSQLYRYVPSFPFRKHFKSRFPAANVRRLNTIVATDTFFSDTPAADDGILGHGGSTMAQIYVTKELFTAAFPMQSESQMPGTLQDYIRKYGAPFLLFSDNAKVQIGKKVQEILRWYKIDDAQCEPHYQHQNHAERRIGDIKRMCTQIMDRTGTPLQYWLLCLLYVVYLLNHLSSEALFGLTPIQATFGEVPDVSALLLFHFWQPVYYDARDESKGFPSKTTEKLGRWVGIAENKGDVLTYWILTDDTKQCIARSVVRPVNTEDPNLRLLPDRGEELHHQDYLFSANDIKNGVNDYQSASNSSKEIPSFLPSELLGLTYLKRDEDTGQVLRAKIIKQLFTKDNENERQVRFLVDVGDGAYDEIVSYNTLCDIIERQHTEEQEDPNKFWAIREFKGHKGPLTPKDPNYAGSTWNILVLWENGEETWEPLGILAKDDPISVAKYGLDNDLLDKPGWKRLKSLTTRMKKFLRQVKQSKIAPSRKTPVYQFGIRVPRNYQEVLEIDKSNGNTKWQDACNQEINLLNEYSTFKDLGLHVPTPTGYTHIRLHWVFAVKQDLRHRARLVALGNLTKPLQDSVYSGVVSLRSLRLVVLLSELNGLKISSADIASAYLEAKTKEKVCFTAGPEFGELKGHTMIIYKALYGLRSSGARYHEKFADTLREMNFFPCKTDPDVWVRKKEDHYEYVAVYVDDLCVVMKDPNKFYEEVRAKGYKLKSEEHIKYHLGGDFYRDPDGTLVWSAKTYVKRILNIYENLFKEKPTTYETPLMPNDHPELDTSEFLDQEGIAQYQSLIGALQWSVSLCRYDIQCAVMTMGRYRCAPREKHLDRLKRICGYLKKYPDAGIRFRVGLPDYSELPTQEYDWEYTVYGNIKEEIPWDVPEPLGKPVLLTTFVDANLMHDMTTGRSVTGILQLVNQTPIDWFSKRQDNVETATYGSEFVAARQATEQVMDIRQTLRYMGVPIQGKTIMFGDNRSVITSSTLPESVLKKRHNVLAYHRVREAIAAKILGFYYIKSEYNPADCLTKLLPHRTMWSHVKPYLFWKGDTMEA